MRLKKRFVALAALVGAIAAISTVAFADVAPGTYTPTASSFNGANAPSARTSHRVRRRAR